MVSANSFQCHMPISRIRQILRAVIHTVCLLAALRSRVPRGPLNLIFGLPELIDARGTQEPQGVSSMFYTMIQTILEQLPGGVSLPVQYPAGAAQNTTSGEKFVVDTITQELREFPNQKYALFGYSQGATVMLRALSQLSGEATSAVKTIILVGNPYRLPGKASNVNETGLPGNDYTVGMFVDSAIANNETIPQLSNRLDQSGTALDYCLEVRLLQKAGFPRLSLYVNMAVLGRHRLRTESRLFMPSLSWPSPVWIGC